MFDFLFGSNMHNVQLIAHPMQQQRLMRFHRPFTSHRATTTTQSTHTHTRAHTLTLTRSIGKRRWLLFHCITAVVA